MEFSTDKQVNILNKVEDEMKLKQQKEFVGSQVGINGTPRDTPSDTQKTINKNLFLDKTLREMLDEFVMTWHQIIMELLDHRMYKREAEENKEEWWDYILRVFKNVLEVFIRKEHLFYVGLGMIVVSFFLYFIFVVS